MLNAAKLRLEIAQRQKEELAKQRAARAAERQRDGTSEQFCTLQEIAENKLLSSNNQPAPTVVLDTKPTVGFQLMPTDGCGLAPIVGVVPETAHKESIATIGDEPIPTVGADSLPTVGSTQEPSVGFGMQPTAGVHATPIVGSVPAPTVGAEQKFFDPAPAELATNCESTPKVNVELEPTGCFELAPKAPISELIQEQRGRVWLAENTNAVFPFSRLKRISLAQDAMTHPEESVYDFLWGPKSIATKEEFRFKEAGYREIAKASRLNVRTVQRIIDRLIGKGFIELDREANIYTRTATRYRVLSYKTVLKAFEAKGRKWVVRTGSGILFVHPAQVAIGSRLPTVAFESEPTVGAETTPAVGRSNEPAIGAEYWPTVGPTPTVTVGPGHRPTVGPTPTHSSSIREAVFSTTTNDVVALAGELACWIALDDHAVEQIWNACRQGTPDCTVEEVATLARTKQQLIQSGKIDNPAGLLIKSVPKFFENGGSAPLRQMREHSRRRREEEQRQQQELRLECQRILDDLNASTEEKEWAQSVISSN